MAKPVLLAPHEPPELFELDKPNSIPWDTHKIVSSTKINGNRCLCIKGLLFTRSMQRVPNVFLPDHLSELCTLAEKEQLVIDMELCDKSVAYHAALSGIIESYHATPPDTLNAYIFDAMPFDVWQSQAIEMAFSQRIDLYYRLVEQLGSPRYVALEQRPVSNGHEALELFHRDITSGDEGSMLRTTNVYLAYTKGGKPKPTGGFYKHGRATLLQQIIWKMKANHTVDGVITQVIQRKKMRDDVEREYDMFGNMKRTHKQEHFDDDDSVGAFEVAVSLDQLIPDGDPNQHTTVECVFGKGFPLTERRRLWHMYALNPEALIGKCCEIQHTPHGGMAIENGGKLKGAKFLRFRPDKDTK